ncbi:MAG: sugar phosphate isomerase/epimerase [Deltaproteobacteria bacterium]|nr:sugar phosphate isomerase/epimerase [Deltaproteobacteria bacterium]
MDRNLNRAPGGVTRRRFSGWVARGVASAAVLGTASAPLAARKSPPKAPVATRRRGIKLGLDNYSVRDLGLNASQLIDYASQLQLDSLFITDLQAFSSLDDGHMGDLQRKAKDRGIDLHLGTWSICPTSTVFRKDFGDADQHLITGIRVAKALGSPVLRVILGAAADRKTPGGIKARIADMVAVLKRARSRAVDAGIKIAVENHSGDMRGSELLSLVQQAGPDFVGVNIDPGNAAWALEDPRDNLEILGKHVVTSSMRDSVLWPSDKGITVRWTAMGEGAVDFVDYFDRFETLCPGVPVHIETISAVTREFPIHDADFWELYPGVSARDLSRFVKLAHRSQPRPPMVVPQGAAAQKFERDELERSLRYCRTVLGLGLR